MDCLLDVTSDATLLSFRVIQSAEDAQGLIAYASELLASSRELQQELAALQRMLVAAEVFPELPLGGMPALPVSGLPLHVVGAHLELFIFAVQHLLKTGGFAAAGGEKILISWPWCTSTATSRGSTGRRVRAAGKATLSAYCCQTLPTGRWRTKLMRLPSRKSTRLCGPRATGRLEAGAAPCGCFRSRLAAGASAAAVLYGARCLLGGKRRFALAESLAGHSMLGRGDGGELGRQHW